MLLEVFIMPTIANSTCEWFQESPTPLAINTQIANSIGDNYRQSQWRFV
jgi:hypothetical protein